MRGSRFVALIGALVLASVSAVGASPGDVGLVSASTAAGSPIATDEALAAPTAALPPDSPDADPVELTYATMSDGVSIALAVTYPRGYVPGATYPTLFSMSGYSASVYAWPQDSTYVQVHASMRGTGCSGGQYHLFGERAAQDGYEIIEDWIVDQPWSDARVGIVGHSFWGLMGFLVTATNPPHAKASAVSGLIDEFYRGNVYIGGVQNYGFPVAWGSARYRPDPELAGLEYRGLDELQSGDPTCAVNIASRPPQYPFIPRALAEQHDGEFWRTHALERVAPRVEVPIHIRHQYQDEQTGPRGFRLWELVPDATPKRLVLSNGRHDSPVGNGDRRAWLDCWILHDGQECPRDLTDPDARVQMLFDTVVDETGARFHHPWTAANFPADETDWRAYHLRDGGLLTLDAPDTTEPAARFETAPMGDPRLGTSDLPASVTYMLPFSEATAFAGPALVELHATVDGLDADVFVEVADLFPDGRLEFLQRGMLRTTHRAVVESASDRIGSGPLAGEIWRPFHPHTSSSLEPVVPGQPLRLQIEVPAFGHVFQPGHALVLRLSSPPDTDRIGGTYSYASPLPPTVVSVLHQPGATSRVLLPHLAALPANAGARQCGTIHGVACLPAPAEHSPLVEQAGCLAVGMAQPTCSFTATGTHTYAGQGVNEFLIRVYRSGELVHEEWKGGALGNPANVAPWRGTIPSASGDRVDVEIVPGCVPGGVCGTSGYLIVGNPTAS